MYKSPSLLLAFLAATGLSQVAFAANCSGTIDSNDAMQFSTKTIELPRTCKSFTLTLRHTGKLARNAMGHNLVITRASDMSAVGKDGISAGLANDYVKPQDTRVIAASKLIGGGESTAMTIPIAQLKADTDYVFFCSFPGHSTLMRGVLKLTE